MFGMCASGAGQLDVLSILECVCLVCVHLVLDNRMGFLYWNVYVWYVCIWCWTIGWAFYTGMCMFGMCASGAGQLDELSILECVCLEIVFVYVRNTCCVCLLCQ